MMRRMADAPEVRVRDDVRAALLAIGRVLTFRASRNEYCDAGPTRVVVGLLLTWLAGVGRHWDDPRAKLVQRLGVGSVAYVFALAFVLWLIVAPLRPQDWSYRRVLTFVSSTAPPAFLYAIPVERWMSTSAAATANIWFLAVVAAWRVALLFRYLRSFACLGPVRIAVVGLLPLAMIVSALTALNLQHVVFRIMGGLRDSERSPHDGAYGVLFVLTVLSVYAAVPLVLAYGWIVVDDVLERRAKRNRPPPV